MKPIATDLSYCQLHYHIANYPNQGYQQKELPAEQSVQEHGNNMLMVGEGTPTLSFLFTFFLPNETTLDISRAER